MSKRNLNILFLSIGISIFGFLMDGDAKEPSTIMRFVEFFAMITIIFILTFSISKVLNFTRDRINLRRG